MRPLPAVCDVPTFETLIEKCCNSTFSLQWAREFHCFLTTMPIQSRRQFLCNIILSVYSRCSSLRNSQSLLDRIPHRNLSFFNSLIVFYSRARNPNHATSALKLLNRMRNECLQPSSATFKSLLHAAALLEDLTTGSALHTQLLKSGFHDNASVQACLLDMYSNCGDLDSGKKMFGSLESKDATTWGYMIRGTMKNGESRECLRLFGNMVSAGIVPTQSTLFMVLNACRKLACFKLGQSVHAQLIVHDAFVGLRSKYCLLDLYRRCHDTRSVFAVFSRIEEPDIVSWNLAIGMYSDIGDGVNSIKLFNQLRETSLLKPDEYTYASIIYAIRKFQGSAYGKAFHGLVGKQGFESFVCIASTLVSMYFRNGDTDSAVKIFSSIPRKDVFLWTDMIAGYSRMTHAESAIKFYSQMLKESLKIDDFILSAALGACAHLSTLRQGEMIHSQTLKTGYHVGKTVCVSLIDMYAKSGSLRDARTVFALLAHPDLTCSNSMLGGYSYHGMAREALELFEEMRKQRLAPDDITFISLLAACSHCGLVDEGKFLWEYMAEIGLNPNPKHYGCMVTLLSRAGMMDEAKKIIHSCPFKQNHVFMWKILLRSCIERRNFSVGSKAAEKVLSLDVEDRPTHVMLSNLHALDRRWECAAKSRRKIKELILEKDHVGLSWIILFKDIHVFNSGDESHPRVDEAKAELQRLQRNMVKPYTDSKWC